MPARRETELYHPIKEFLTVQGYEVRSEVSGCDLVAVRDNDMVVVELKARFNLDLVLQGIARQQATDAVYLAVEAPRRQDGRRRWSEIQGLCRRLGLGLITVRFTPRTPVVETLFDPAPYTPRRRPGRRSALLREFRERSGDYNTGGSTRRPIVTAYREEALRIAAHLRQHGPSPVRAVRAATGSKRVGSILLRDVYGWFERTRRGTYALRRAGEEALALYADVVGTRARD